MRKIMMCAAAALTAACSTSPAVHAVRETAAVSATGDAADDPAIWVAPEPSQSLVIGTQKQGGLYVFDLSGAIVQEAPGGRPNNVDIREGFPWPEGASPIVAASDRTDNSIVIWRFNTETRRLEETPRARIPTGLTEVYGFCLGRVGADYVALVTDRDSGDVGVWRVVQSPEGAISGERIAAYSVGSIAEGCVFDDEAGIYYLAQEMVGIWRIDASDAAGAGKRLIDTVGHGGNLAADVEGLSIWLGPSGAGYLVASVQGPSRFAVYNRGDNAYRGSFRIAASADGGADAVQGTDGIDVSSAPLGPDYPRGLLVAQDDVNSNPRDLQNFKYVSWADVAGTLMLD